MANFHIRSNSFPSQSHPVTGSIEDQLCRLRSSEATSTSASSVCANLDGLRVLHEGINDQMKMSSIQQVLSHGQGQKLMNKLLEGSLRLVDLCGFSREVVQLTKESVQSLESSMRRMKGETVSTDDINTYISSRNGIKKMINKYGKSLKSFNKISAELANAECDLNGIWATLKEAEALALSTLKSVLTLLSGEKERSSQRRWPLLSKFVKSSYIHSEVEHESCVEDLCSLNITKSQKGMDNISFQNMLKQLKASEMTIQEIEEGLEALFRSLVKTRVSLLNVVSH